MNAINDVVNLFYGNFLTVFSVISLLFLFLFRFRNIIMVLCRTSFSASIVTGTVRHAAPIRNSLVQFSELRLSTVVNFSSANLTNKFVIGLVRRST